MSREAECQGGPWEGRMERLSATLRSHRLLPFILFIYLFWKAKADDKGRPVTWEPKEKGGKEGIGQRVKEEGVLKRQRGRRL